MKKTIILILILFLTLGYSKSLKFNKYKSYIKVWHHFNDMNEIKNITDAFDLFKNNHPDVKIQNLSFPFFEFKKILIDNLTNNIAPDIAIIPNDWLGDLKDKNLISEIDTSLITNFFSIPKSQTKINNKYYALPFVSETLLLFYNKNIVKTKPPENLDLFIKLCQKLKEKCYPLATDINSSYYLLPWYMALGGKLCDKDNIKINKKIFIKTCNFWLDLKFNKKIMFPIEKYKYKKVVNYFVNNNLAFIIDGPWVIPYLKSVNMNFGVAKLPYIKIKKKKRPIKPFSGTQVLIFRKNLIFNENIKDLIKILLSDNIQLNFSNKLYRLPVTNSALKKIKKNSIQQSLYEQFKNTFPLPSLTSINKIWSILSSDNLITIFNKSIKPLDFINKHKSDLWK